MKKFFTLLNLTVIFSIAAYGQVQTPAITFQSGLAAGKTYGISIASVSGNFSIDWGDGNIIDYTGYSGIKYLGPITALGPDAVVKFYGDISRLRAGGLLLTTIDVTNCPDLLQLEINDAKGVTSIDVSQNPKLATLVVFGCTKLTSLDVSQNPELNWLTTQWTNITSLDLTNNPKLQTLLAGYMPFVTSIDVTGCPLLKTMECFGGYQLTGLDLSQNPNLTSLKMWDCNMNACALNKIYGDLPAVAGTIIVTNTATPISAAVPDNEGSTSMTSIATGKGWSVLNATNNNGSTTETLTGDGTGCPATNIAAVKTRELSISPNPVLSSFTLSLPDKENGVLKYAIVDISGKKVQEGEINKHGLVDINNLSAGIYFVKTDNYSARIIKK